MDLDVFPRGVLLGVSVAAPVGPIGLLTIRRTINYGFRMGFATGLGAATADAIYGAIAAFGLTAVMAVLTGHADLIRIIGGLALLTIGTRGLIAIRTSSVPGSPARVDNVSSPLASYVQTTGLTLTNPMTILTFIGFFAGVGVSEESATFDALVLVLGVAVGSALWWLGLAAVIARVRHRLSPSAVRLINLGSSIIIIGFGIVAILAAVG